MLSQLRDSKRHTGVVLRGEVATVSDEGVVLHLAPLAETFLADGADVAVLLLPVLLHADVAVALEVADLAFELYDPRMNALVRHYLKQPISLALVD